MNKAVEKAEKAFHVSLWTLYREKRRRCREVFHVRWKDGRKEGKDSSSLILQTLNVTFSREILENAKSRVFWRGTGSRKLFIQSKPVSSMQSLMKRAVNKESVAHLAGF